MISDIDDLYLMGFDLICGTKAITNKESAVSRSEEKRSIWDFEIFQHPTDSKDIVA